MSNHPKLVGLYYLSLLTVASVLAGVGLLLLPGSFWMTVRQVEVLDFQQGKPGFVIVNRTVNRDFRGDYAVVIRDLTDGRRTVVCEAHGGIDYEPGETLPDPVTLDWWAYSDQRCHGRNLAPGTYDMTTTWTVRTPFGFLPDKLVRTTSPAFTVRPKEKPEEATE